MEMLRPPRPVSYALARPLIRRALTDLLPTKVWTAEVYGRFFWFKVCKVISNGADVVLLARLRAGYTLLLAPFLDPWCPLCKDEPQNIENSLRRGPRLGATRHNIFGSSSLPRKGAGARKGNVPAG